MADNLKQITPEQYAAGVDRGIKELQDRIKELSKVTPGARTLKAGRFGQTRLGREELVQNAKEIEKLKKDLEGAKTTAADAKQGYKARYEVGDAQNMSANPDAVVYRYPFSEYYTNYKPQRGRRATGSAEK